MRKFYLFWSVLLITATLFPFTLSAYHSQPPSENERYNRLDSIVVGVYRSETHTPITTNKIDKRELERSSSLNSIPMSLSSIPSLISTTEGGSGLGYSSLRIRGSDQTRINVTLNGVALNDGESHQLFWVNIPALQNYIEDIEVTRGVGSSVNGAAAFGASLNMRTLFSPVEPYGGAELGIGSWGSFTTTFSAGSGRLKNGLSFDLKFNKSDGNGYIRGSSTNLKSLYSSLAYTKASTLIRANYIMGDQISGITWEGISREQELIDRRYNPAGLYFDVAGNEHFYPKENDNYRQHLVQLHLVHGFSRWLTLSSTLHLTRGEGFYENYKWNKKFSSYGLPSQQIDSEMYSRSDFIIKQALDNWYGVFNLNLSYKDSKVRNITGLSASHHTGSHYGNVVWSLYNSSIPDNFGWYTNGGDKSDLSLFNRMEYYLTPKILLYGDLQYRFIEFQLRGDDKDFVPLNWSNRYHFFNPKGGINYIVSPQLNLWGSVAVAHKEPSRADIKESIKGGEPEKILPERLTDFEFGLNFNRENFKLEGTLFFMEYDNQLIPTGRLSETGYLIKENVKESYRRGVELGVDWTVFKWLNYSGNFALSSNKILNLTQYLDLFDSNFNAIGQEVVELEKSTISFSPSFTTFSQLSFVTNRNLVLSIKSQYVGKQYMNNIEWEGAAIDAYRVESLSLYKLFNFKGNRSVATSFYINNLFSKRYFSNGWHYLAMMDSGDYYQEEGIYPQPYLNWGFKATFKF